MKKLAVVLFNLGGPDSPDAVQPFLFNLFNDPAIIRLPNPFRYLLAKVIAKRRAPLAKEIYKTIGGKSPLLENTMAQAHALEDKLNAGDDLCKSFIAMRYWKPFHPRPSKRFRVSGRMRLCLCRFIRNIQPQPPSRHWMIGRGPVTAWAFRSPHE